MMYNEIEVAMLAHYCYSTSQEYKFLQDIRNLHNFHESAHSHESKNKKILVHIAKPLIFCGIRSIPQNISDTSKSFNP